MLKLVSKITFNNNLVFDWVNDIEINSCWENLTDTCKITVPRKVTYEGKEIVIGNESLFKRGDSVKVEMGYDNNLVTVFTGYISKIHLRLPLVFECEDQMYLLKKNTLPNAAYSTVSLSQLLKKIIPSTVKYKATEEQGLGKIRYSNNATTVQVLGLLRQYYNIYSFFRDGVLYVGLPYVVSLRKDHTFDFEKNIIDNTLEYMKKDDVKIKVRAVSIDDKNKKVEYFYPNELEEGEQKTIHKYNLTLDDLKKEAKRYYDTFKYEGYKGVFTTFGEPYVNHGDGVTLQSNKLPEISGTKYLVKSVRRSFGVNGYRQTVELANRI